MYALLAPRAYAAHFDGSRSLFGACWRQYRAMLAAGCDYPHSDSDVTEALEQLASLRVNNPRSRYYIYG